jgi:hypothetical protein
MEREEGSRSNARARQSEKAHIIPNHEDFMERQSGFTTENEEDTEVTDVAQRRGYSENAQSIPRQPDVFWQRTRRSRST